MVSKCANPACSTPFHYLREGKVFRVEVELSHPVQETIELSNGRKVPFLVPGGSKPARKTEHYWLCGPCSQTLNVQFDKEAGFIVLPKEQARAAHAAAS
jgi:hypothetical protein